jgi:hypothetical protein
MLTMLQESRDKSVLPPPHEAGAIRNEIEKLERARQECLDSGIRKVIDGWIAEQERKLVPANSSK